jgi:HSP20 family protein
MLRRPGMPGIVRLAASDSPDFPRGMPIVFNSDEESVMQHALIKQSLLILGLAALVGPAAAADTAATQPSQGTQAQKAQPGPGTRTGSWDPWKEMRQMQNQMDQMFENAYARMRAAFGPSSSTAQGGSFVTESKVTVKDQDNKYVVTADMPGVKKADVNVSLDGRLLRIAAQSKAEKSLKGDHGKLRGEEVYASSFQRALTLPGPVDASGMRTDFKDGVLTVIVPKAKS